MKNTTLFLCFIVWVCMLAMPVRVSAQIAIKMEINHKNFHQFEPIFVRMTFRNMTGKVIAFSDSTTGGVGSLSFIIENNDGVVQSLKGKETPPVNGLLFRPGGTETMTYCLSQYYRLLEVGKYRVKAILEHPQVSGRWESNSVTFTIGTGVTVWERIVGVPDPLNSGKTHLRKYVIRSFYDGTDKIFYLIVEDERLVYAVIRIGYDVGASIPDCEVDEMNRLHIILQANPDIFSHFIYDWNGVQSKKQVYQKTDTSPTLVRDTRTGSIRVAGGKKAIKDVNFKEESGTLFKE